MKLVHKLIMLFLGLNTILTAQTNNKLFSVLDVQHYKLAIEVNDSIDSIDATMDITIKFKQHTAPFYFDLVKKDSTGKGMHIEYILQNNDTIQFTHSNDKINLAPNNINTDSIFNYKIKYNGIPKDGLVIGKNLYNDRTYFGDNWPNRAHNWFPCIDHPSDKATIEYIIKAPNHYQTIANGFQIEETNLDNNLKLYHWKTEVPLPTKVMVVGIAKFAVQNIGETHNIPVSTWVYPQTKAAGFYDFSIAKEVLNFFIENVGEYPFLKLANVQSKTRFGGMENAGNIFYFEKSVTGNQDHKDLIAHEIAHQWFGNSATEIDWPHIWLSEGFATYLTDLYILKSDGEDAFKKRLNEEREKVLNFYKKQQTPIIDTKTKNYMSLLNPNSYQKGGWVLHMLRLKIGDENFWKGIQTYYNKYKLSNASTSNFKNIMAEVSKQNLDKFFMQWLEKSGQPILKTSWLYSPNKLRLLVHQTQDYTFEFPLDIELIYKDGSSEIKTINVTEKMAPYAIETNGEVTGIKLDPNMSLLFESFVE
ncbi:M1 family metallopeptidase [Lutibacter flavus]|uniref:Aminopeptidase N n=1 Tax=Lutibacter flavus TaxID=691689 RepID=A0A238YKU0_9FLAO|nr:M1 family metallopeptidase [Lutibacter flavus]SNR71029.1 Peptidase family M1 [Lutibacter flavus]